MSLGQGTDPRDGKSSTQKDAQRLPESGLLQKGLPGIEDVVFLNMIM